MPWTSQTAVEFFPLHPGTTPVWHSGRNTHLEAAGLVGSACRVHGMQSGAGQAARSWRPILPFKVEEDTGIRLCWSHSCFH